jgi:hypothetical protein
MSRSEAMKRAWARRKQREMEQRSVVTPSKMNSRIISYRGVEIVLNADVKRVILENDSIVIP